MAALNYKKIWNQVLEIIKKDTTPISYKTWFLPTQIRSVDTGVRIVYLQSEEDFVVKILRSRYLPMIENSFREVLGGDYKVVIKNTSEYGADEPVLEQHKEKVRNITEGLNEQKIFIPKYNFDEFVVGNGNKYAHAAALAVAEAPSQAYNPLYLYGGSGLGKTHLMHAIGIYIMEHHPELNVLYVSSEMFTNEFIKSIKENKSNEFKNKYRQVDVLLIDDIQFLEGKETSQQEFFYTFNTLFDLNKQIVISSDRPPNKLNMMSDRLRSRFAWNMNADISPPDSETRVAILNKKAEVAGMEMTDDLYEVICLISEKITDNIRELEGALTRIRSFSKLMNEKIDVDFARRILKDILVNGGDSPTPEKIKTVVARYFNIKVSEMESSKRTSQIALPRQIAMYLCRNMTDYSLPKIGNLFGGRHYTTVMHACDKIQKAISTDDNMAEIIQKLKDEIKDVN